MAAPQPLHRMFNICLQDRLPANERRFLEAFLTSELISVLMNHFNNTYSAGKALPNTDIKQGNLAMLDTQFIRTIIKDIISMGDYTLEGIARYTGVHEDLIHDAAIGINTTPSVSLFHRLVVLHRSVRPDLYDNLRKNIFNRLTADQNSTPIPNPSPHTNPILGEASVCSCLLENDK